MKKYTLPKDPLLIDYLLFRALEICGLEDKTINPSDLESELEFLCSQYEIKSFIDNIITDEADRNSINTVNLLVSALKDEYERQCLTKDDFVWLEDEHTRLVCYAWRLLGYLAKYQDRYQINHGSRFGRVKSFLCMNKITTQEVTKSSIIKFINRLECSKHNKINITEYIKSTSVDSLESQTLTKWLTKDCDEKTDWAYRYLTKKSLEYIPLSIPGSSQLKNDIISFFDVLYNFNKYRCQLLILEMKKAWDTKTYRDKNTEKKRHSIDMSHDIDDLLKEMCIARNEHKNSLIERLIRAEYKNFNTVKNK